MTKSKKPERLSEWLNASIIHQIKKQERLLKKLPKLRYMKTDERMPVKSVMEKIEEFNRQNEGKKA